MFALKVLLPYFCHNVPWFIQLLWATGSAYQYQAVVQGNSIIPLLPPAVTEEESTGKEGRTMSQNKEEKGPVTPQNPPVSTRVAHTLLLKARQELFSTAGLKLLKDLPDFSICMFQILSL